MSGSTIKQEILKHLEHLPLELQRKVLDYAVELAAFPPQGVAGEKLLRFAGCLPPEDATAMAQAIESACESIEAHEW